MAIAFDNSTDGGSTTGTSKTFSHTCTGSDLILFVAVVGEVTGSGDDITSVTYNSVGMTLVAKLVSTGTLTRNLYLYRLIAPTTGAHNVVISCSGSHYLYGMAVSYTGVEQTTPIDTSTTQLDQDANETTTVNVTTTADGDWLVMIGNGYANGDAPTAGTGTTRREFDATDGVLGLFDSNGAISPAGSASLQWTYPSPAFDQASVMAAFKPADAGAASSYTFEGPTSGLLNVASTNFTVTPNGDADGIEVTPASDGSGSFTPSSVTFSGSDPETFTYTPTSTSGSPHTLSVTNDGALTDPDDIDYTVLAGTIAIGAPVTNQFKRSNGGTATFTVSGTYTGAPSTIEVSTNGGGAWSTLDAAPSAGSYTGTVNLSESDTDYTIQVRFSNATAVTASVSGIAVVGFVVAVGGQSNEAGRGDNNQTSYAAGSDSPHKERTATGYGNMTDPTGVDGSAAGSYALLMVVALGQGLGKRGAIVNRAMGGTTIAEWQKGAGTTYYETLSAAVDSVGGCTVLLMGPCESDAINGTSQGDYHDGMEGFRDDWLADHPESLITWRTVQRGTGGDPGDEDAINAAIVASWSDLPGIYRGADVRAFSGLHFTTDAELGFIAAAQAARALAALNPEGGSTTVIGANCRGGFVN